MPFHCLFCCPSTAFSLRLLDLLLPSDCLSLTFHCLSFTAVSGGGARPDAVVEERLSALAGESTMVHAADMDYHPA